MTNDLRATRKKSAPRSPNPYTLSPEMSAPRTVLQRLSHSLKAFRLLPARTQTPLACSPSLRFISSPSLAYVYATHLTVSTCLTRLDGRPKRYVDMQTTRDVSEFTQDHLPVQWQAWLRHTRPDPPTIDELIAANHKRELIIQRAKELDRQWAERKLQIQQENALLIEAQSQVSPTETTPASSHESEARRQARQKPTLPSTEATGQGDTFQPGSWAPTPAKRE
ncbi:hypothetical protein BC938DRAFT_481200 [Jimgerdemannia flammicorona]|uniref:NADH dehydrogenase [ubiquinone] 1 alpha subcomplex subunit n=1 Tax=Jimgerdemannia flammicorona TaxID=994334 RepID=A0A433QX38_9FUNG|nr:hypothetical protein BC938DRAFT_481200 [Jimgerdemannia flammicorona]